MSRLLRRVRCCGLLAVFFTLISCLIAAAAQSAKPGIAPSNDAILHHLNAAIRWYRRVAALDVTAGQPSDVLYLENARNAASQALQLAFQASLAEAKLAETNNTASPNQATAPNTQAQGIANASANLADRITQTQSQIDSFNKRIATAPAKRRQQLIAQRDALQGQLDLDKTMQDALQKISSVALSSEMAGTGLTAQIAKLKQSVPEFYANTASKNQPAPGSGAASKSSRAQNSGLLGETEILFGQMSDIHDIDQLMSETEGLRSTAEKLDAPLRDSIKNLAEQGRNLINQSPGNNSAQIEATRQQFDQLTAQVKAITSAAVPLREEIILLEQCHGDLQEWRNSIAVEYAGVLRSLLTRVIIILIALGIVFLLSALWRRATYRYVHDRRRRRQLLLVRRFVIGFLMVVIVALGFISEFSSLATFAGFITAGIAVALQSVILSIAAYFFLIGRYGVKVGDRITVSGVTGDVIEIGLVRLYLMELSGTGIELYPTGRVAVFSNSVMFQTAPFFKQLPGTAYAWHEAAVTLAPGTDYHAAEQTLLAAVNSIFEQYRHNIDHQHAAAERLLETSLNQPVPKAHLRFTDAGLEFVVRYPVEIPRAAEIDDQISRELADVLANHPELKGTVTGTPKLRAAIKA